MKFGEALKLVFDSHYKDLASSSNQDSVKNTRYTNEELKHALILIPAIWRADILREFAIIEGVIRKEILSCPHNSITKPYQGREECVGCGSHRILELEDKDPFSYNERMIWSKWDIG